ncbi:type VII toxin-antitoxin system HepT family RNase toxin [Jeotgalibacillus sp. ET6]|uniref:type VII toxin-antitoxin system HepT family RNase toxin n=1 Tax=Jeotgalibacillus sp. ET6 TaxID=3037260 RepID=UPI0030153426
MLNLQRACEASIGIAMYVVAEKRIGLPQNRFEAFTFLEKEEVISSPLSQKMKAMVGFQRTAVHDCQEVNVVILQNVIEDRLVDFMEYTKTILAY